VGCVRRRGDNFLTRSVRDVIASSSKSSILGVLAGRTGEKSVCRFDAVELRLTSYVGKVAAINGSLSLAIFLCNFYVR